MSDSDSGKPRRPANLVTPFPIYKEGEEPPHRPAAPEPGAAEDEVRLSREKYGALKKRLEAARNLQEKYKRLAAAHKKALERLARLDEARRVAAAAEELESVRKVLAELSSDKAPEKVRTLARRAHAALERIAGRPPAPPPDASPAAPAADAPPPVPASAKPPGKGAKRETKPATPAAEGKTPPKPSGRGKAKPR